MLCFIRPQKILEPGAEVIYAEGESGDQLAPAFTHKEAVVGKFTVSGEFNPHETVDEQEYGIIPFFHILHAAASRFFRGTG
jgi:hypothetical protein